jgi:hypothetical protein
LQDTLKTKAEEVEILAEEVHNARQQIDDLLATVKHSESLEANERVQSYTYSTHYSDTPK